ncbi:hypothetical protein N7533_000158 [Penicillium manginii]|uniref:uncharacterized protein n=1 Tax=Penicillium manginii TaxID=203109 RepID=UPI00254815C3|nr:uncharacterized protein N7533_000158 [Penicillium manginii]KAJ5767575.1 hypothetical protein N7533_000158 [Penicillium manginii]
MFRFLDNQIPREQQIPSPERTTTNPVTQTRTKVCSKKECGSPQDPKIPTKHQETGLSRFKLRSFLSAMDVSPTDGIQRQLENNPAIQEVASSSSTDNPQQCLIGVPQFVSQFGSAKKTDLSCVSALESTYFHHEPNTTHGGTTSSPHEWLTSPTPEPPSNDSYIASPGYTDDNLAGMVLANDMIPANELPPQCTPNTIQLGSSPNFLANEELEAYRETLTSEYVTSCQTNLDVAVGNSDSFSEYRTCAADASKRLGSLQAVNQSLDPDHAPEGLSCESLNPKSLSPKELYLCSFFL